jgi:iron complex outermembrane receptor protein
MFKRTQISTSVLLALGAIVAMPAMAQDASQRVEITGSNIRRTEIESASPLQTISAAEMKASGYTTVSEVLRDITANGQGTLNTGFRGAFAAGASGISLRGLSLGATLVLIDGYRMAPYPLSDDGQRAFVDISAIPFSAVERIEILKDGASAIYGSEAVAGVVNVILKKAFDGTQVSGEVGGTQHGGGVTKNLSVTHGFGKLGDPMNGYVAIEWRKQDQILVDQRSGPWTNMDWRSEGGLDLRPGARNPIFTNPRLATPYLQKIGGASGVASNFAFYPGCTHADMRASNCTFTNNWGQIQPNSENLNLVGRLNFKLSSDWDASVSASYFDSKSQQLRAPSNIPFGSFAGNTAFGPGMAPVILNVIDDFTVPANYPGNTLGVKAGVRAMLDPSIPRVTDVESKSYRLVADIGGNYAGWDLRGALGHTRVETTQVFNGYINYPNLLTALNRAANPFLLTGGNSADVLAFVAPTARTKATDELDFLSMRASRDVMQLGGGPLGVAVGLDFRYKSLNAPNPSEVRDGSMALPSAFAFGDEHVTSAYVEAVAPVTKTLELSAAVRADRYDTYGTSTTPKVGFKFSPVKEFAVRGTFAGGFRAPNAAENGTAGAQFAFNAIRDPQLCPVSKADGTADNTAAGNVPAYCSFNPTYLQNTTKDLQPEKSKSYTLGIIAEPMKNWSLTFDYYNIEMRNQIIPAASLSTYNPLLYAVRATPQQVTFGDGSQGLSAVGPIQYVTVPYVNGQTTTTSGVELETRYKLRLANAATVNLGLMFTHMIKYDMSVDGNTYHLAGTHGPSIVGGNTGNPRNRAQFSVGYEQGPFSITATTNYISSYDVTDPSSGFNDCQSAIDGYNSFFNGAPVPAQYCRVKAYNYTNLTMRYQATKNLTIRGSITNLFDQAPPLDLQTYGAGSGSNPSSNGTGLPYNPSMHQIGAVGRSFNVGVDWRF